MVRLRSILKKKSKPENNNESIIENIDTHKRKASIKKIKAKKHAKSDTDQSTLHKNRLNIFETLNKTNYNIQEIVHKWINIYRQNNKLAMTLIIRLFLKASSSKYDLKENKIKTENIEKMLQKFGGDMEEKPYPHSLNTKESKIFKFNFDQFFQILAGEYHDELLFQGDFFDTFIIWLKYMSQSNIRPFRHISTVCCIFDLLISALILCAAFCTIHCDLSRVLESRPKSRKKSLQSSLNESFLHIESNVKNVKEAIETIFNEIFVLRYRDVLSEIRILCVVSLNNWIISYSTIFLKNEYLKYIGWMLNDRNRIIDMCFDVNDDVCSVALTVVLLLYTCLLNVNFSKSVAIPQEKLDAVLKLICAESQKISRNSALILIEYLSQNNSTDTDLIKKMIDFSIKNQEVSDNLKPFVASFFNISDLFRPINFLTNMVNLLDEGVSSFIISFLPKWLKQYRFENDKILHILNIANCVCESSDLITLEFLTDLFHVIQLIILSSVNQEVLECSAIIFEKFSKNKIAHDLYSQSVDTIYITLISNFNDCSIINNIDHLSAFFIRITAFSKFIDISKYDCETLISFVTNLDFDSTLLPIATTFYFIYICWGFNNSNAVQNNCKLSDKFINFLLKFLNNTTSFKSKLFQILCDYCFLQSKKNDGSEEISKIEMAIDVHLSRLLSSHDSCLDLKNDVISFAKLVNYNFIENCLASKIFIFYKFTEIRNLLESLFINLVSKQFGYFFNIFFEYLKNSFEKKVDIDDVKEISRVVSSIVPISAIKKDISNAFPVFYQKCLEYSIFDSTQFLTYILPFKRSLILYKNDIMNYIELKSKFIKKDEFLMTFQKELKIHSSDETYNPDKTDNISIISQAVRSAISKPETAFNLPVEPLNNTIEKENLEAQNKTEKVGEKVKRRSRATLIFEQ
ncbi:hypothetical protein HZS_7273 [Henneguya salminicola]|nr:hypothetical protein HZS_7273 [Henneguya salminicola]